MPENYEEIPTGTPPETPQESPEQEDDMEEKSSEESALVPKSLFGDGVKPGDTITMKVVNIYEDEVEVAPAGEAESEMPMKPMMAEAEMGLDQLAQ